MTVYYPHDKKRKKGCLNLIFLIKSLILWLLLILVPTLKLYQMKCPSPFWLKFYINPCRTTKWQKDIFIISCMHTPVHDRIFFSALRPAWMKNWIKLSHLSSCNPSIDNSSRTSLRPSISKIRIKSKQLYYLCLSSLLVKSNFLKLKLKL